jgi:uncharacterized protein
MKLFDFNIHLPRKVSKDVNDVIADDLSLDVEGLVDGLKHHYQTFRNVEGVNVLLFNQNLFHSKIDITPFTHELNSRIKNFLLTCLIDFRMPRVEEYMENAKDCGVRIFMFNSYLQKIAPEDFGKVLDACRYAEANKIAICIDGSYGTSKMYQYDNMKLACLVADAVSNVPIIIIHSGGYRVMEAMLLAMDKKNVMLDTSFSLNYYLGSSLELDYAFAYRKLGADRILFGSDLPYVNFAEAVDQQVSFFVKSGFSSKDIERIFYGNAIQLIDGVR